MSLLRIGRYGPEDLGRHPFLIGHALADHPLFALDRLLALACRLAPESTDLTPSTGLSLQETIRRIEVSGAWVSMKNVEQDPPYGQLLDRCLDEVGTCCGEAARGMSARAGFIFITSPGAITPCHLFPDQSFLLQIRGRSMMHIYDRPVLPGAQRTLRLPEGTRPPERSFLLSPQEGVHVPFTAPHWAINAEEVSISFSIAFHTPSSRGEERTASVIRAGSRPDGSRSGPDWPSREC